ncbi:MAG: aminopeptidase P family protein [Catonella sp.]|nr:aminopeptidase P family protein [Catonella sp.]MDY6357130.1 aminopeptidase P family protein [Catonella sp.]
MSDIITRLQQLRKNMKSAGVDIYMIPTADFHDSEYAGTHFAEREFMSGFTGSAGTLVVTMNEAALWTDGRYFLQAAKQLEGTGIDLMKMGQSDTPEIADYIYDKLPKKGVLGFDGRTVSANEGIDLADKLAAKKGTVKYDEDLVDSIWKDRPPISTEPAFFLPEKYTGRSIGDKLSFVRNFMKEKDCDAYVLTSLDDIAWLYNIRGNDIPCNPVVMAYSVILQNKAILFLDERVLNDELRQEFAKNKIKVKPYNDIYRYVKKFDKGEKVLADLSRVNYAIFGNIPGGVNIIDEYNPTTLEKSKKNDTEIANIKNAHVKDAVAMVKFIYWLKTHIGKEKITELSASDYLEGLRAEQEGFIEISFTTIAAYNENAAMLHYEPTKESDTELAPRGFLLVDSGGQYYEGTTDITRTIVLGDIPAEWKRDYTLTLKGNMNLANAHFLAGCTGVNLDILCRAPLWNMGLDYRCGTGHGVGYLLNVHEAPNSFRWKVREGDNAVFEPGMITTDEPGVYTTNSHGIRIENEMLCVKDVENEYGQFLKFEPVTYVPIDKEAIDIKYLNDEDIKQINDYHKMVFEKIASHFSGDELEWLKQACAPLSRF